MTTSEYLAPCVGSGIKIEFTINLPEKPDRAGKFHLGDNDVNFTCTVYSDAYNYDESRCVTIAKGDEKCKRTDEDWYRLVLYPADTETIGAGVYTVKVDVSFPDDDFPSGEPHNGLRHEIIRLVTDIPVAE